MSNDGDLLLMAPMIGMSSADMQQASHHLLSCQKAQKSIIKNDNVWWRAARGMISSWRLADNKQYFAKTLKLPNTKHGLYISGEYFCPLGKPAALSSDQ